MLQNCGKPFLRSNSISDVLGYWNLSGNGPVQKILSAATRPIENDGGNLSLLAGSRNGNAGGMVGDSPSHRGCTVTLVGG